MSITLTFPINLIYLTMVLYHHHSVYLWTALPTDFQQEEMSCEHFKGQLLK